MTSLDVITFGCRLNAFESEVIRGVAGAAGVENAVIVNTCAVTAEAERQARQAIRRARREHPNARIIVTGCAATLSPGRYAALAEVDLVLDNKAKLRPESYIVEAPTPSLPRDPRVMPGEGRETETALDPEPLSRVAVASARGQGRGAGESPRARAYLQVQQ